MDDPIRPTMKGTEVTHQEHPDVEAVLLYAEGRADAGTSARVEAHLSSGCASCRETAAFMDDVIGTFRADAALAVPVEVRESALELFRSRTRQPSLLQQIVATLAFD